MELATKVQGVMWNVEDDVGNEGARCKVEWGDVEGRGGWRCGVWMDGGGGYE